jgi:Fe-S-cluster-containing dehydrogenase component
MKKWHMIIDIAKCHDCNNCFLACKDEYVENDWPPYSVAQPWHGHRWIDIGRKERGQYPLVDVAYRPTPCMHCDNAPCIAAAGNGAIYKRDDGIVIIDPEKAGGWKDLVDVCPYGAIWWNEEKGVAQKCTFCVHLLAEGWDRPRCVQACPTGALRAVLSEDTGMEAVVEAEGLQVLHPHLKTRPRVFYKNLYRYDSCFIAGSVALADKDECAEGAKVSLTHAATGVTAQALTNNYGDFKFDNLAGNSGAYLLTVEHPDYEPKTVEVEVGSASVNAGVISL